MKYIFKQIDNISGSNAVTTIEFDADYLPDILEHFEMFLRGSGFHPSGNLDFVPEDEYYGEPDEQEHEWTQTLRSDSEWPFPQTSTDEKEQENLSFPWSGVSGQWTINEEKSTHVMDWTAANLIRPPKMLEVCPVCKIDNETMAQHECWDNNCPKGKDAN